MGLGLKVSDPSGSGMKKDSLDKGRSPSMQLAIPPLRTHQFEISHLESTLVGNKQSRKGIPEAHALQRCLQRMVLPRERAQVWLNIYLFTRPNSSPDDQSSLRGKECKDWR